MFANVKLYIDIGIGLLVLLLIGFAGWEYDQRKLAADKLAAMGVMIGQQAATLAQLQQGQAADSAAIAAVAASAVVNAQHGSVVRARVATMEANDAKVHDVLSIALPAGGCLLDDTCGRPGNAGPAVGGASAALR